MLKQIREKLERDVQRLIARDGAQNRIDNVVRLKASQKGKTT